jgi:uncharacterized damage-inducible protein DinB
MNKEVQSLIKRLENTHSGEPWFGRSVQSLLAEVDAKKAAVHKGGSSHTMLDILWHMNTWAAFTLDRIKQEKNFDLKKAEGLDWRKIDPKTDTWKKALAEYEKLHKDIIKALTAKDDDFLIEIVEYRKYNFRYLINGFIEHAIYHAGQIALLNKMPDV